jgi:hypothetical protein
MEQLPECDPVSFRDAGQEQPFFIYEVFRQNGGQGALFVWAKVKKRNPREVVPGGA